MGKDLSKRLYPFYISAACAIILTLIYLNGFSESAFTVDDETLIQIPQISAPASLSLLKTLFTPGNHIDFYPVRDLAYWIQVHLFRADPLCLNMTVYHLFSFGLFFGILFCMSRILERRVPSKLTLGLLTAVFAFLPFHSEMLMWASAQKDLLAILFGLVAMDQIDLWTHSKNQKHHSPWLLAILCFSLSFMSKASLVLLPPVVFLGFVLNLPGIETQKRHIAMVYSAVLSVMAFAWSMLQSRIYEDVNDMRFFYPFSYRLQASMAALGREITGIFNPNVNIIDIENWGTWLRFNSHFVPMGFLVLAIALGAGIYSIKKKNKSLFVSLIALATLYIPTSGLIFQHRNFYSTRYLEPALICGYLLFGCVVCKIEMTRYWKQAAASAALIIVALLTFSFKEADAWSSSRTVIQKSLSRHPDRLSLKAYLLTTLRRENQWGRLTRSEVLQLQALEHEIANRCGLSPHSRQPDDQDDRDDCMWTWMEVILNPKNRGTDRFQKAAAYLQTARARLLPQKIQQLELRTEIIEASYGRRPHLSVAPETLIKTSGWGVMPQGRARIISALCLTGHMPEATLLYEKFRSEHLLNNDSVNEVFSNIPKKNWESFKTLQSCFEVSHRSTVDSRSLRHTL